ncbi:MAG: DUF1553 domain-containing protein [Rubripirellula sp.]|nr:DUF1553 domain-containing protein [Rubripirellula sp.]
MQRSFTFLFAGAVALTCAVLAICDPRLPVTAAPPEFADGPGVTEKQLDFFETRIRPVLVEHCYSCHNSADLQEGDLALDDREGTRAGGSGGAIIVPGDPEASRLIDILKHEIDGLEMPQDGPRLENAVITDFKKWIGMGAPDPRNQPLSSEELAATTSWEAERERRKQWWSFQPIVEVAIPAGNGHPVDQFIRSKLSTTELQPSPPADPTVLIRRLFITLIGLPPTRQELIDWQARYTNDKTPSDVTDALIDSLMGSVHFGERWARHWLDWIRYAESHGSEGDPAIDNAWVYRDYLIRAMNADIPYDTLVREHIAGDLLAQPRINAELGINESMIGPSHWRMVFHGFAPTDALDEKVRFIDDQINVFSKAFLGLTISCARCHNHKFDAISQKDYYALFGILASCRPARQVIDVPEIQQHNTAELEKLKTRIRLAIADDWLASLGTLRQRLRDFKAPNGQPAESLSQTLESLRNSKQNPSVQDTWSRLVNAETQASENTKDDASGKYWKFTTGKAMDDWYRNGVGLQTDPSPAGDFSVLPQGENALRAIYPSGIYTHSLSAKHGGRLTSHDFKVAENQEVWIHAIGEAGATTRYVIEDYPRNGTVYPVTALKPTWTWHRFDMSYWKDDAAHLELVTGKDAPLLTKNEDRSWFGVREIRITKKGGPNPKNKPEYLSAFLPAASKVPTSFQQVEDILIEAVRKALVAWNQGSLSDSQADLLNECVRLGLLANALGELPQTAPLIAMYRDLENQITVPTRIPGLDETQGRTQALFVRGNHKQPAETVPRRFLEAFDETPYPETQSGRLQLADDVLRDDNPLTRRVIVNRIWHHLFGKGISQTPDNFGRLGRQPTHPELLDWLANRFEQDGWSLKSLIRLIVTSDTWQQSSLPSEKSTDIDPGNELLSHANVRRAEAEVIRDSLLVASGKLDRQTFGRPVGGGTPRRSVYVQVIRNRLDPLLRVFDFPEPFTTTGRRDETNVPAQFLTMMNDPQINGYANGLANDLSDPGKSETTEARITRLFQTLFSRQPNERELETTTQFLASSLAAATTQIAHVTELQEKLTDIASKRDAILSPVRTILMAKAKQQNPTASENLRPIARWEFDTDLSDTLGNLHGTAVGNALVKDGHLVIKRGGYITTSPLKSNLTAKTLEVWVAVSDLNQSGGGVLTIQSPNGIVFDSIVFGEKDPRQWLAGSNGFRRTTPFSGPQETSSPDEFVHVAISYHSDGRIMGYRNGKRYGKTYTTDKPVEFSAGNAIISFGIRHLPAGGNRMFHGRIDRAKLYDRALNDDEVAASYSRSGNYVSHQLVLDALPAAQRTTLAALTASDAQIRKELSDAGPSPNPRGDLQAWTDLAKTMLTLKEFIYVR